jgi:ribosomal protein L14E/L6E/L27E
VNLLKPGQVVFSKRGRDRGTAYVVVQVFAESSKEYAYLADGDKRPVDKPKKKKSVHIQPTKAVIPHCNNGDAGALDAHLRKELKKYSKSADVSEEEANNSN